MKDLEQIKKELNEATALNDGLLSTGLDKDIVHLYFESTALYIHGLLGGNQEYGMIDGISSESEAPFKKLSAHL